MSKSLIRLRKQNKKLRKQLKSKVEIKKLEEERIRLGEQNRRLLKQLKRSPTEKAVRRAFRNIGRDSFIVGKTIGKGLIRYGRFLDQKENTSRKRTKSLKRKSRR